MATRFIAKHGLKSNINRLTLSEGEIAIAYNDDRTTAEIYSGSKDGTPILLVTGVDVAELLANAQEYTNTKISELVDGAPEAMDTLKELADAISKNSDIMSALQSAIGNKANVADLNTHTSDTSNPHGVTKEQVGLGNVDNTSDIDKPVSTATQEALDGKSPKNHAAAGFLYGKGTGTLHGHVRLSDSVTSSVATSDKGIAATPYAVKTAYDKAVEGVNAAEKAQETADGKLDANFVSNGYVGIDEVTTTLSDMWSDRVAPPTTITVSSSTSKHMLMADYYCNGTNDQTVIQQAIDALPSTGGKIVLLEGTYNISGTITIYNKKNVTLQGLGRNVIFSATTSTSALYMIKVRSAIGVNIFDIDIDYTNNTSGDGTAIRLYTTNHTVIERVKIQNSKGNGIEWYNSNYTRFSDISFINVRQCVWDRESNHSSIFSRIVIDTATNGIVLASSSTLNKICDCIVRTATDNGIKSDAAYTMINDNIVYGCGVGITANGNCSTVSGNNARDNNTGISVNGKMVNVSGNTALRTDDSGNVSSYSSSQYTILMGSSSANCLVIGNIISGKNYTNNGASTNTFANNKY